MAVTVSSRFIDPPNYSGTPPDIGGFHRVKIQLTCVASGADTFNETKVNKLDISTLVKVDGVAPAGLIVESIVYDVSGYSHVLLEFDRTTDAVCAVLATRGRVDCDISDDGSGDTGDILLSSVGGAAGSAYNILLAVRLK